VFQAVSIPIREGGTMRARAVIYIAVAVIVGAFFIANWALFSTPVSLNVLFARVETPLALLLLVCVGVVLLLDLTAYAFARHKWRAERRQLATEMAAARLRAERAEVRAEEEESRTQALPATMEREFAAIRAQLDRVLAGVQRLTNDTTEIPIPPPPRVIEPELIPPRSATARA
jgi:hypothetical protein